MPIRLTQQDNATPRGTNNIYDAFLHGHSKIKQDDFMGTQGIETTKFLIITENSCSYHI